MSAPCRSRSHVTALALVLATSVAVPRAGAAPTFQSHYDLYFGPAGMFGAEACAVGDVNGDGRNDVVTAVESSGGVGLLSVNLGRIGADLDPMPVTSPLATNVGARWLQLAYVNQDAHLDAVVSGYQHVHVSLGVGDGTFPPPTSIPMPGNERTGVGDLNGDGFTDLAIAQGYGSSSIQLHFGDGAGAFTVGPTIPVGIHPATCYVVDADGDTYPDLMVGDDGGSALLRGTAGGSFVGSVVGLDYAFPADLDLDGYVDAANISDVALGNGDGTLAAPIPHGMTTGAQFAVDLNGDDVPDLVGQDFSDSDIRIRLGDGAGGFGPEQFFWGPRFVETLTYGDADTDGRMDLVGSGSTGIALAQPAPFRSREGRRRVPSIESDPDDVSGPPFVYIHRGTGDGGIVQAPTFTLPLTPRSVAVGDLDASTLPDIVVGFTGSVGVALATAPAAYSAITQYAAPGAVSRVAAADMDGDGRADVLAYTGDAPSLSVWLSNANGTLGSRVDYLLASGTTDFEVADLDGDGDRDVVVNGTTGNARILPNTGSGTLGSPIPLPVALSYDIDAVHLNGDTYLDLVSLTSSWDPLVLIASGPLSYPSSVSYPVSNTSTLVLEVGRFDGDAIPDILIDGVDFHLFRGLGGGAFSAGELVDMPPTGGQLRAWLEAADFDGDGFDDVVKPGGTQSVASARSNGDGTFEFVQRHGVRGTPAALAIGDLDGNGRMDVVSVQSNFGTTATILLNLLAPPVAVGNPGPAPVRLAVRPVSNPARGALELAIDLPVREPFTAELVDVTGRRIVRHEWSAKEPGRHTVAFGSLPAHSAGIYFVRVQQGSRVGTTRVALLP